MVLEKGKQVGERSDAEERGRKLKEKASGARNDMFVFPSCEGGNKYARGSVGGD
jgi:hypothetical protein